MISGPLFPTKPLDEPFREPGFEPGQERSVNREEWNETEWLGVPFDTVDWSNLSTIVAFIREYAGSRTTPERRAEFNRMADQLAVTRKKVQARVAAGAV
jgi:hypothetical protein